MNRVENWIAKRPASFEKRVVNCDLLVRIIRLMGLYNSAKRFNPFNSAWLHVEMNSSSQTSGMAYYCFCYLRV